MAQVVIHGGAFQDAAGNPIANGYLRMWLSHDSQESTGPGEVAGALAVRVPLDGSGNILGTVSIWPNAVLNPSGSYYLVELYTANGIKAWKAPQQWTIPNTTPFDVGTLVPNVPPVN